MAPPLLLMKSRRPRTPLPAKKPTRPITKNNTPAVSDKKSLQAALWASLATDSPQLCSIARFEQWEHEQSLAKNNTKLSHLSSLSSVPPWSYVPTTPLACQAAKMSRRKMRSYRRRKIALPLGYEKAHPINVAWIVLPGPAADSKPWTVAWGGNNGVLKCHVVRKSLLSEVQTCDD